MQGIMQPWWHTCQEVWWHGIVVSINGDTIMTNPIEGSNNEEKELVGFEKKQLDELEAFKKRQEEELKEFETKEHKELEAFEHREHVDFEIRIDRTAYKVSERELTGLQLRNLVRPPIGQDRDLFEVVLGGSDRKILDTEEVKMRDGLRFFTAPAQINPGADPQG